MGSKKMLNFEFLSLVLEAMTRNLRKSFDWEIFFENFRICLTNEVQQENFSKRISKWIYFENFQYETTSHIQKNLHQPTSAATKKRQIIFSENRAEI